MNEQRRGCLIGSFFGDALALGLHWIYDAAELAKLEPPSTFLDPRPDSYHPKKRAGDQSHTGDQAVTLLRSLATKNSFVATHWRSAWEGMWEGYPDYFDKATKHRLAEGEAGPSDELAGAARVAPLVAFYGPTQREALYDALSAQTAETHAGVLVRSAAWCLAELACCAMETRSIPETLDRIRRVDFPELDIAAMLDVVEGLPPDDPIAAVGKTGRACPAPQALPAVLYFLRYHADAPQRALALNVVAGGDNCVRGLGLGMVLGAAFGLDLVPNELACRLSIYDELMAFPVA